MARVGRPRTSDRYAIQREKIFDSLDRVFAEQRKRILSKLHDNLQINYPMEELERRHRLMRLGPALHHKEDLECRTIRSTSSNQ